MTALPAALNKRGLEFLAAGNYPRATDFFREAIAQDPSLADAYTNLGVTLFMTKQFDAAVMVLDQSFALRPDHAENLLNLGYARWRTLDLQGAVAALQRAVDLFDQPLAHIALGSVYHEIGNSDGAIHHCRKGLEAEPDNILAHDTLRDVYLYLGDEAAAMAQCEHCLQLFPNRPEHTYKHALVKLTYDNPEGWAECECRYETSTDGLSQMGREEPYWFGRLFGRLWGGKPTGHLLVQTEQGYGDVIQFLRYLPLAAQRCDKLLVHIPAALRKIVKRSFDIANMELCDEMPDHFDHYCLIMSLAYLLDATADIPSLPYLVPQPNTYDDIRRLPGAKIGIAWGGSKTHPDNLWRSIPFEKMKRLLDLPATFISLQIPCNEKLTGLPIIDVHPTPTNISGNLLVDWMETAALIDALDLVVAVDTAVLHMAGALGKPVWLLNRYNTDWRWGLGRTTNTCL
jgi:tetratricopeptide (TPR) repeat protein